jgi:hypothetical protein
MKTRLCLAVALASVATATIGAVSAATLYVSLDSPNPTPPFTSWATAATNIQQAVDAAAAGDDIVVTNGQYATGERAVGTSLLANRVAVDKPLRLRSVNGPQFTIIQGASAPGGGYGEGAIRCVYLTDGASLSGFTLTNGAADSGGGVSCASTNPALTNCVIVGNVALEGGGIFGGTLYNCVLSQNHASGKMFSGWGGGASGSTLYNCSLTSNSAGQGGGVFGGTLYNCTVTGNSAWHGGGACGSQDSPCTLYNCTLAGNSADYGGGGASGAKLYNCIAYFNVDDNGESLNYEDWCTLNYCCTTPLPTNGVGNINADPRFADAAAGDLRLRPDSPCIDAGTNLTGIVTTDVIGLPRPLDGNGDGIARFDIGAYEFNPYRFEPTLRVSPDGFQFTVKGEPGKSVRIERSRDLLNWEWAATVPIPAGGQTLIDPAATTGPYLFYRAVSVR